MNPVNLTPQGRAFAHFLADAPDGLLWLLEETLAEASGPLETQRVLNDVAVPLLSALGDAALDHYVPQVARLLKVRPGTVRKALPPRAPKKADASKANPPPGGGGESDEAEKSRVTAAYHQTLERFGLKHFKVWYGGDCYIGRETVDKDQRPIVEFVTQSALERFYSHVRVPLWHAGKEAVVHVELAKKWLKWPQVRTYERVIFDPGNTDPASYNLWKGLALEPKPGDCSLYKAHVRDVICAGSGTAYAYVWKWLAFCVQRPWDLPEVALVLRSRQGAGKGTFTAPLMAIFGQHAKETHSAEMFTGRFDHHLANVKFLFADESTWAGDHAAQNKLKGMVTERRRFIEAKHKDAMSVDSYLALVIASNNDNPVAMDHDDRRFYVLDVAADQAQRGDYFTPLRAQMSPQGGGTEALLHELLSEDLTGWHPRGKPKTSNGFDIKLRYSSGPIQWWFDCLQNEANERLPLGQGHGEAQNWNDCPVIQDLHEAYAKFCDRLGRKYVESLHGFSREIKKVLPHASIYRAPGDRRRRWKIKTCKDDCRPPLEAYFHAGPEIWEDEQETAF